MLTAALLASTELDWRVQLQNAVRLHGSGDLVGAVPHYRKALELHSPLSESWPFLNNYALSVQQTEPAEAAAVFRHVLSLVPESPDGYFNLGNALSDAGEHKAAVQAFGACVHFSPADGEAYYNLGSAMLHSGASSGIGGNVTPLQALALAQGLTPTDGKVWLTSGDALSKERRWDEAAVAYGRACTLRPQHGASWVCKGNCDEERGHVNEAELAWHTALQLNPGDTGVYQNLGRLLRRTDRMPESRASYASAITLSPQSAEAYSGLGKCYGAPPGGLSAENRQQVRAKYALFLARTYGIAADLEPRNAGTYNALGEGMTMFGLRGSNWAELGDRSALDFYRIAHSLMPANTCAATHVAFGLASSDDSSGSCLEATPAPSATPLAALLRPPSKSPATAVASVGLADLSVKVDQRHGALRSGLLERAFSLWCKYGVVVFPSLLSRTTVEGLLEGVRRTQHERNSTDYTQVTRNSKFRVHKALPVAQAQHALNEVAERLGPFVHMALGVPRPAQDGPADMSQYGAADRGGSTLEDRVHVLESGFMVTAPGADEQQLHRDVAPAIVSNCALTASIQVSLVDTAAKQGSLQVVPGSHTFDPASSDKERLLASAAVPVPIAVPAGSVVVYALHLMHSGRANEHVRDRPFYFFTVMGGKLDPPPGLAYTIELEDIGRWELGHSMLVQREREIG